MSDLTQCNFCALKQIRKDAKKRKIFVDLIGDNKTGLINVFVGDLVVSMKAIGDHCECGD